MKAVADAMVDTNIAAKYRFLFHSASHLPITWYCICLLKKLDGLRWLSIWNAIRDDKSSAEIICISAICRMNNILPIYFHLIIYLK